MKLLTLMESTCVRKTDADPGLNITSLCYDSRKAVPGSLFFALRGEKTDGLQHVPQAKELGAIAVVTDSDELRNVTLPVLEVQSARVAMGEMAAAFYDNPAAKLKVMGVTGTNGKTTIAFLVKHILDTAALRCGLIGTIKYVIGDEEIAAPRTTPESVELQEMLSRMVTEGCRSVAMEVSSHALSQARTQGIDFDTAVFTNLTQDHLDFHGTLERYFEAKSLLFSGLEKQTAKRGRAIINIDDRFGRRLAERFGNKSRLITYGQGVTAQYRASNIKFDANGAKFQLEARERSFLVRTPLIGLFNVYNSVAALAAAVSMGVPLRDAVGALANSPQIPGRVERVPGKRNFQVYVDYAHTDDALRNVLKTLKDLNPARLITVFGCGGDRDRAKRPLMAAAAEEFSDWTIITSDNPRSEDPEAILNNIQAGFRGKNFERITGREGAIRKAVELAKSGDIVLVAGKGHETYQEFSGGRIDFDDVAVAARAIAGKKVDT